MLAVGSGSVLATAADIEQSDLVIRMLVALGLTYAIGFERELRRASAGDRTFALVGLGSAIIGYLALADAPNALAGVVTGVGFIGAGVILHSSASGGSMVRGVTTAATIYLAAAIGAAAGQGQLMLATVSTALAILLLEIRHMKPLHLLDGRHWAYRFVSDDSLDDATDADGDSASPDA